MKVAARTMALMTINGALGTCLVGSGDPLTGEKTVVRLESLAYQSKCHRYPVCIQMLTG